MKKFLAGVLVGAIAFSCGFVLAQTQPLGGTGSLFLISGNTATLSPQSNLQLPAGGVLSWAGRNQISSSADAQLLITPSNGSSTLSLIDLGGASTSPRISLSTASAVTFNAVGGSVMALAPGTTTFNNLNLVLTANGQMIFCSDCAVGASCAGAGTGAFAKRQNNAFSCT